jgi:hypothetical protein
MLCHARSTNCFSCSYVAIRDFSVAVLFVTHRDDSFDVARVNFLFLRSVLWWCFRLRFGRASHLVVI